MEANSKGGAIGSLLSAAAATGGNLVEKALAIDDALGQWEDQVHSAHPTPASSVMPQVRATEGACLTPRCAVPCRWRRR